MRWLAALLIVWSAPALAERPVPSDATTIRMTHAAILHAKTVKGDPRVVAEPFAGGGGAAFTVGPLYGTVLAGNQASVPYDLEQWMGGMLAHHQHLCGAGMAETFLDAQDLGIKIRSSLGFTLDCPMGERIRHTVGIVMEEDGLMVALTVHAEVSPDDLAGLAPMIRREAVRYGHTIAAYIGYGWPGPPQTGPDPAPGDAVTGSP